MKHYLTKYYENGKHYAESWLQINIFGKCYCFSRRRIQVGGIEDMPVQINIDADRLVEEVRRELIKQQEKRNAPSGAERSLGVDPLKLAIDALDKATKLERDPLDTFAPENRWLS